MKFAFKDCIWNGPYIVVKILSNSNYVERRTGTRYTQTLHRIRLRLYAPNQCLPDVTVRPEEYLPDPEVKATHDDWYAQAWETEFGDGRSPEEHTEEATITEIEDYDETTAQTESVKTTENESLDEDKTFSINNNSLNLDVSNNPYIMSPLPINPPPQKNPEFPPIVVGYNPRKIGRYNLRPNPKPNANPDFRMIVSLMTEDKRQPHS